MPIPVTTTRLIFASSLYGRPHAALA
jgi:hypothetical protein